MKGVQRLFPPHRNLGKSIPSFLAFFTMLFMAARVKAQSLSLTPSSGPANCLVMATASGFPPDPITKQYGNTGFYLDNVEFVAACPGPAGASSYANCTVSFRMPVGLGDHTVTAQCGTQANATFTVESPTMSLTPTWGLPGTSVTVNGSTFAAVSYAAVYLDGTYQTQLLTDESGNFTTSFTVSSTDEGTHVVLAHCGADASANFYITTNGVGTVGHIDGNPTITPAGGGPSFPLQSGMPVSMNDTIHTGPGDRVFTSLNDGTQFTVSQNSSLTIDQYTYDPNNTTGNSGRYNFLGQAFSYVSGLITHGSDSDVKVQSPMGAIGIRGTQFIFRQDPCSSAQEIYLIEGELAITPQATPGVTNILDGPVSIFLTTNSVTTNMLTLDQYNAISNEIAQSAGVVTYGSWAENYFGCTNNNPDAAPDADPDGDGQNNYAEFLAGTNPTNKASAFRILSAAPEGKNVRVTWACGGGHTNVLQTTANLGGSWSNVSSRIVLAGIGDSATNYLDLGAITNAPARYYRVLLLP